MDPVLADRTLALDSLHGSGNVAASDVETPPIDTYSVRVRFLFLRLLERERRLEAYMAMIRDLGRYVNEENRMMPLPHENYKWSIFASLSLEALLEFLCSFFFDRRPRDSPRN